MGLLAALRFWWTRLWVMGHDDDSSDTPGQFGLAPVEFRRRRAEAIRALREEQRRVGKPAPSPHDPSIRKVPPARIQAVFVAPGRRVGWEPLMLPGGYSFDDMLEGRISYNAVWAADLIRALESTAGRMDAKIELYDREQKRRKAAADEAERERRYQRAIEQEARDLARRSRG